MRVAIYSRKSIETDQGESIHNQIKLCKDYFLTKNNCTFQVFEDEGYSGSNTNRPAFKKMMDLIKNKQFDIVSVYKLDRIARNIVDFVNIYNELDQLGVQLVSITEGFDPSTPIGKMMMLLLASFAEMERLNITERIKDNMKELAKLGRWTGGTPPKGYRSIRFIEGGKKVSYLKLNLDEKIYIKTIFQLYAKGLSSYKISKYLKENYFVAYSPNTIQGILNNPTYLISSKASIEYLSNHGYCVYGKPNGFGFLPYNRRPKIKGLKKYNFKDKFVGVSKHEGIIQLDLWARVQDQLKKNTTTSHKRKSEFTFLSGLIKCKCGANMFVYPGHRRKNGSRVYYFKCSGKSTSSCSNKYLRVDLAEEAIYECLSSLIDTHYLISLTKHDKVVKDSSISIQLLHKKIISNEKAIANLVDKLAFLSNEAATFITSKIEVLTKENTLLKKKYTSFRKQVFSDEKTINLSTLHKQMLSFFKSTSIQNQRLCIEPIIHYIIWDSDHQNLTVYLYD